MRTVKLSQLRSRLSGHLRAIEEGTVSEITATDRGQPIARIVPIGATSPRLTILPPKVPFAEVRGLRFKPAWWPVSSPDLLLEDRGRR